MKNISIIFILIIFSISLFGQTVAWENETTKDGKFSVSYRVYDKKDPKGNEVQILEYIVETTARVSLEKCIDIMKNDDEHTRFMDDAESSTRVKTISQDEWITYYYFDLTWPMPNSDGVTKFKLTKDTLKNTIYINAEAVPNMYPDKGVKRIQYNSVEYVFQDLGNGEVKISMSVKVTPVITAPDWLIKSWFPDGASATLKGLIKLAQE